MPVKKVIKTILKPKDKGKKKEKDEVKAYLHVVYAAYGDASILEFHSGELPWQPVRPPKNAP